RRVVHIAHSLSEQVFAEVYIACQRRRRPEVVRDTRYVFVDVGKGGFFGFHQVSVLGETVEMATRERALLDAVDRPRYAGGIGEVSRMVSRSAEKLSWDAVFSLLEKWNDSALVQRLGYFLDLHGIAVSPETPARLLSLVRPRSKIHLGPRRAFGAKGKLVRPWNIVENVPADILSDTNEPKKRRARLTKTEPSRDRG